MDSCVQEQKELLRENPAQELNQGQALGCLLILRRDGADLGRKNLSQDPETQTEKTKVEEGADHAKEAVEDQGQAREQA